MEVLRTEQDYSNGRIKIVFQHEGKEGSAMFYVNNIDVESESFVNSTSLAGFNTMGKPFAGLEVEIEGATIDVIDKTPFGRKVNPTRVFWLIYKVSKRILCPECI